MPDPLWQSVGLPILTTGIGVYIGYRYTLRQTKHGRLTEFRQYIDVEIAHLDETEDSGLEAFHDANRSIIRDRAAAITDDVGWWWRRSHFRHACMYYNHIEEQAIRNFDGNAFTKYMWPREGDPPPTQAVFDYTKGRQRLRYALQKIKKYAR